MIDQKFLVERQGRTFALYAGLLDAAHHDGLKRITTTLVQVGSESNGQVWIVSAEVETARGVFGGIGDASPSNVNRAMLNCLPRMAETRAKARALRDAVNAGALVAVEELGEDHDSDVRPVTQATVPTPLPVSDSPATESQRRAITRLGGNAPASITTTEARSLISRLQAESKNSIRHLN